MSYSEEGEQLADTSPCAELRARLKMCLLESDCCKKVIFIIGFQFNWMDLTYSSLFIFML